MNTVTSGRLNALGKALAYIGDDLMDGSEAERDVSRVLHALHTAILLDATAELAQLVRPWMVGKLVAGVRAMAVDDADRENAIFDLKDSL